MILCPNCKAHIGVPRKEFKLGDQIMASDFNFEPGQEVQNRQKAECAKCNMPWIVSGCFFTDQGWFPYDPYQYRTPIKDLHRQSTQEVLQCYTEKEKK